MAFGIFGFCKARKSFRKWASSELVSEIRPFLDFRVLQKSNRNEILFFRFTRCDLKKSPGQCLLDTFWRKSIKKKLTKINYDGLIYKKANCITRIHLAGTQSTFPNKNQGPALGKLIRFKSLGCTQGYSRFDPFRVSLTSSIPRILCLQHSFFHRTK
jgi:hypothetical protein